MDGLRSLLGPLCAVLAALGAYVGGPGAVLGPMLAILSRSWASTGWAALGASVGGLVPLLGSLFAILAALGPSVGGPGPSWPEKWLWPQREGDRDR